MSSTEQKKGDEPRLLSLTCYWCGYPVNTANGREREDGQAVHNECEDDLERRKYWQSH